MILRALTSPRFLPCVMLALQAGAAIRYAVAWRAGTSGAGHVVYWLSAVGITYAVTFLKMGGR